MRELSKNTTNQRGLSCQPAGFTMIELLLYMGIFSILLVVLLQIFTSILSVKAESESSSSIDQEMSYVLNRLTYDIHRASDITSPSVGNTSNSLLVLHIGGSDITYQVQSGKLLLNDGATINAVTSDDVTPSIQFQTLGDTSSTKKKSIRVILTLTSKILRDKERAVSDTYTTTVQTR